MRYLSSTSRKSPSIEVPHSRGRSVGGPFPVTSVPEPRCARNGPNPPGRACLPLARRRLDRPTSPPHARAGRRHCRRIYGLAECHSRSTFLASVTDKVALCLSPGDVMVMDNLSTHKSPADIRAVGASRLYLPANSPDLSHIGGTLPVIVGWGLLTSPSPTEDAAACRRSPNS
jgi:hypothetical protein